MTEIKLAKRVINELQKQIIKTKAENDYLLGNINEVELERHTKIGSRPQRFNDEELSQMIRSLMKLTNNSYLTPQDMAVMINADLTDVDRVYHRIDNLLEKQV